MSQENDQFYIPRVYHSQGPRCEPVANGLTFFFAHNRIEWGNTGRGDYVYVEVKPPEVFTIQEVSKEGGIKGKSFSLCFLSERQNLNKFFSLLPLLFFFLFAV